MADSDRLELIASVKNLTSGPIRDIQRSMRALAADSKAAHALGIVQTKSHTEALYQLRREVGDVAGRLKAGLAPALGVLGISSLSAAAGLAAVAAAVREFSSSARNLSFLTRETGLTINQLRTMEALAPRIGVAVEQMDESLRSFGENMEKLRRSPLSVLRQSFEALSVRPDPQVIASWRNLISSMQGLPRAEQLARVVGYLDRIRDAGQKRAVLKSFGLPEQLSRLSGKELQEEIDRIRKIQRDLTPEDVEAGKKSANAIEDISLALKNLRDRVGAGLAPDLAAIATSLADFANLHSDEIVGAIRDLATWVKSADWAAVGRDLRDFASGANNVAQALGGWKPVLEFLAAYKIAQLLGLTSAVGGLTRSPGSNLERVTAGGSTFAVNRESAPYLKGFVEELQKGGAPIHNVGGYNYRNIAGSGRLSQHAYGNAIDVEQHSRGVTSPGFARWVQQHRGQFDAAERKWHVYGGERFGDFGHFEYGGVPFSSKEAADIYGSPKAAEALHGQALRAHFGHRAHPDLLGSARQSGLVGPAMTHKVEGSAHLKIDVNGPRGTEAKMAKMDGMFKTVQMSRGRAMAPASQQG